MYDNKIEGTGRHRAPTRDFITPLTPPDPTWDPAEELAFILEEALGEQESRIPAPRDAAPAAPADPAPGERMQRLQDITEEPPPAPRSPGATAGAGPQTPRLLRTTSFLIAALAAVIASAGESLLSGMVAYDPLRLAALSPAERSLGAWWPLLVYGPWLVASLSVRGPALHQRRAVHSWCVVLVFCVSPCCCVSPRRRGPSSVQRRALPGWPALTALQQPREAGPLRRPGIAGTRVDGLAGQLGERHLRQRGQPVVLGDNHSHRLVPHGLVVEPGPQRRVQPGEPSERRVQPAREQLLGGPGQAALVAGHQLMPGGEFTRPVQHAARCDQARGVEVHQQGPGLVEGGEQFLLRLEHAAGVRQQPLSVGRERHLPGGPHEQLGAQFPLQPPHVPAECLLGRVEAHRGAGEVQFLGDCDEGTQESGVEVAGHAVNLQRRTARPAPRRPLSPGDLLRPREPAQAPRPHPHTRPKRNRRRHPHPSLRPPEHPHRAAPSTEPAPGGAGAQCARADGSA
ncbi:hypothetical protein SVIOM74S_10296 [Streptomyces violarus]